MTAPLRARIDDDLKKAMLAKNEEEKNALRMAKADLLKLEADLGRPLNDDEIVTALQKNVKQRRDAIEEFRAGGRTENLEKEEREIAILSRYLPKTLDADETRTAMRAIITELSLQGKKDMGRLMKELKARHAGIDGKLASQLAPELLGA